LACGNKLTGLVGHDHIVEVIGSWMVSEIAIAILLVAAGISLILMLRQRTIKALEGHRRGKAESIDSSPVVFPLTVGSDAHSAE
jgi:hypothetical protein